MLLSLKSISLFCASMALYTLGNILLKKGMNGFLTSNEAGWKRHWTSVKQVILNKLIMFGLLLFVCEAIIWLAFLSITPLNIASPLSSANNIFILVASAWFLKERISPKRWLGVSLIITGILFVGGGYS